jgi:hypothetical protein
VSGDATAPGSTVSLFDNGSTTLLGTALVQSRRQLDRAPSRWRPAPTAFVAKDIDLAGNTRQQHGGGVDAGDRGADGDDHHGGR